MSSSYVLAPIRIMNSPNVQWSNLIAVGSNLFAITGAMENSHPCSNVWFLDCRIHTWLEASSMRIAHTDSLFDGKLYLPGSNENPASLNCIEVFNTKTQAWNSVPPEKRIFKLKTMEGKICMNCNGLVCKPKELKWEVVGLDTKNFEGFYVFMVDNIHYRYSSSEGFYWYYSKSVWRKLKGLEGLPKFDDGYSIVKLADYGGKLMVLWDKYVPASGYEEEKMIWCAEISLEKRNNGEEIWGNVEWFDAVLTVPKSYEFVYAIAATV